MGVLTADYTGRLINKENQNIILSTFTWSTPQILNNHLKKLQDWPQIEEELQRIRKEILSSLLQKDKDGKALPLTLQAINQAHIDLIQAFDLNQLGDKITIDKKLTIQCYLDPSNDGYPKPIMLNSFLWEISKKPPSYLKKITPLKHYCAI